jgi:N-acetylmuramoyl-L-alanine amidase
MTIIQKPCASGNWRKGRVGSAIQGIVIHVMDGYLAGTDAMFNQQPAARAGKQKGHPSSAHYGISQAGEIHQYVKDEDTAYHAGNVKNPVWPLILPGGKYHGQNPNAFSIGIEHEGSADAAFAAKLKLAFEWPAAMMQASAELIASLCAKHNIRIARSNIAGHHEIYKPKPCPGDLAIVDKLVAMAAEIPPASSPE